MVLPASPPRGHGPGKLHLQCSILTAARPWHPKPALRYARAVLAAAPRRQAKLPPCMWLQPNHAGKAEQRGGGCKHEIAHSGPRSTGAARRSGQMGCKRLLRWSVALAPDCRGIVCCFCAPLLGPENCAWRSSFSVSPGVKRNVEPLRGRFLCSLWSAPVHASVTSHLDGVGRRAGLRCKLPDSTLCATPNAPRKQRMIKKNRGV